MDSFPSPPTPPRLSAGQIHALIEYAQKMATYMDNEISRANDSGMLVKRTTAGSERLRAGWTRSRGRRRQYVDREGAHGGSCSESP